MPYLNTKERYGSLSISLHWLVVLLLVAVYACVELHGYFPKGSEIRKGLVSWHFTLGLVVFLLTAMRLLVRSFGPEPRIVPDVLIWQKWISKCMHYALYIIMIAMPVMGFLGVSAAGKTVNFFGLDLPNWMELNKPLAKAIINVHETIGTLAYFLIGLHALAALFHHYVQGDNTLKRMWFKS